MNNKLIKIEEQIPTFKIVLNRPEKKNALTSQLLTRLAETLEEIRDDESIRVVVIKGAGEVFCSGADISLLKEKSPHEAFRLSRKIHDVFDKIEEFPKPVIAAIEGFALGGGLELAMACDFRIASNNAKLGNPEINLGILPGGGGTQRLVKLLGSGKAKEMLMLGEVLSGKEAEEIELVNKSVPSNKLEEETRKLAEKLSDKPPIALAILKQVIKHGESLPTSIGETLEALGFNAIFATKDAKKGMEAFIKKEEAEFEGK